MSSERKGGSAVHPNFVQVEIRCGCGERSSGSGWMEPRSAKAASRLLPLSGKVNCISHAWATCGLPRFRGMTHESAGSLVFEPEHPHGACVLLQRTAGAPTGTTAAPSGGPRAGAQGLQIPDVAGTLEVEADLRARQVVVSTRIEAPREGRSKGRMSWLLRQLQSSPDSLKLEARIARSSTSLAAWLSQARDTPEVLYPDHAKEIRQFVISLSRNMGLKGKVGRGSFIDSVITTTKDFYGDVLQNLRAWKAPPPKLKKPAEEAVPEPEEEVPPAIRTEVDQAQEEMLSELGKGTESDG